MEYAYLRLIPFFPLATSLLVRFLGKRVLPRNAVHILACAGPLASLVVAVAALARLVNARGEATSLVDEVYPWIVIHDFRVQVRFLFDSLSAVMALVVTGVGSLIHVYSVGYMSRDKDYERYFAYLNLFMAMMLILVLGDSLLLMFVGWEGVGLCSYLLIGFWFHDRANCDAGKKAFVVNRVGDFGFLLGILTVWWTLGLNRGIWSVDYAALRENVELFQSTTLFGVTTATAATLFLFLGAVGKSAQIPLHVWLPDAMAGPTPVSALIHAATMVTAGVYMVARLSFLYDAAPATLNVVAAVGAGTALFAATVGLVQNDIKKVLAYSTVSQLGYMFLACGVGAYAAGIFHLMTHAFFKALLFLGAGSVIHAMGGEQDMRKMGGLKERIPLTYGTFLVATLAISGIPPLAGFFSKDEILWQAFSGPHGSPLFWAVGVAAAALTAFYMFRLLYMTFFGSSRASEETKRHIHESPWSMLVPLGILAFLSIVGGLVWWPGFLPVSQVFPRWLASSVVIHAHGGADYHLREIVLAAASLAAALGGIWAARRFYVARPDRPGQLAMNYPRAYKLLSNKYWVDELYETLFVNGTKKLTAVCFWFDSRIVDGLVNGSGWLLRFIVFLDGLFDRLVVDGLVNFVGWGVRAMGRRARMIQTGQIQTYLGALAGIFAVVSVAWLYVKYSF